MSPSEIILSGGSALEYHRKARLAAANKSAYPNFTKLPRARNGGIGIKQIAADLDLSLPLELSTRRGSNRTRSDFARCRTLSAGELEYVETTSCPGLRVCSPELALYQGCSNADAVRQALLAYEACGSFAIDPSTPDGFLDHLEPITTAKSIEDAFDSLCGSYYSARTRAARRTLASLADGAASPAEAKLCLAIIAPRTMGGWALPKPELNATIEIPESMRGLTTKRYVKPDEYWSLKRLIVEYLGGRHANQYRIEEDAGRDNGLDALGFRVIHITKRQLKDPTAYFATLSRLREELRVKQEMPSRTILERQESLRHLLFGTLDRGW